MPVIPADSLANDERRLRRAHLTLTYIMHFYVHSAHHDTTIPINIPAGISIPLVAVSRELGIPPILTYADTVLWNWKLNSTEPSTSINGWSRNGNLMAPFAAPSTDISTRTSFTGTPDENHFYMTSAWIELRGVEALSVMRRILDETFLSDAVAARRVTNYLTRLARVVEDITQLIIDVRKHCDPAVFYDKVRPWFHGASAHTGMGWSFEGVELSNREKEAWGVLGGPSAGQSSLVHALDVFLGVDHTPHGPPHVYSSAFKSTSTSSAKDFHTPLSHAISTSASTPPPSSPASTSDSSSQTKHPHSSSDATFLQRMQQYMPRHHRAFLQYLGTVEKPVRAFVAKNQDLTTKAGSSSYPKIFPSFVSAMDDLERSEENRPEEAEPIEQPLTRAYNDAVDALKRFRDAHIRIATLYIVSQSRRERPVEPVAVVGEIRQAAAVGTGGTQLVPFLKGARDNTKSTVLR